jgi:hypothetical protein
MDEVEKAVTSLRAWVALRGARPVPADGHVETVLDRLEELESILASPAVVPEVADPEVRAMGNVYEALGGLSQPEYHRVLSWAAARLDSENA